MGHRRFTVCYAKDRLRDGSEVDGSGIEKCVASGAEANELDVRAGESFRKRGEGLRNSTRIVVIEKEV